eukprot:8954768-Lingulodinium_polyedra.AAC.1
MSWHWGSWPGLLARFASDNLQAKREALQLLRADWQAFVAARELQEAAPFLATLVRKSPFSTVLLKEIAAECCQEPFPPEAEVLETLQKVCTTIYRGWGQTKIVEDGFQAIRDREDRDVRNKRVSLITQWSYLRDEGVIAKHQREEFTPAERPTGPEETKKVPLSNFEGKRRTPTIDGSSILRKADWPTLTAQTSQGVAAEMALLRWCHKQDCMELASSCWKCNFIPAGTVITTCVDDR